MGMRAFVRGGGRVLAQYLRPGWLCSSFSFYGSGDLERAAKACVRDLEAHAKNVGRDLGPRLGYSVRRGQLCHDWSGGDCIGVMPEDGYILSEADRMRAQEELFAVTEIGGDQ